jgi:hypothetical protein
LELLPQQHDHLASVVFDSGWFDVCAAWNVRKCTFVALVVSARAFKWIISTLRRAAVVSAARS